MSSGVAANSRQWSAEFYRPLHETLLELASGAVFSESSLHQFLEPYRDHLANFLDHPQKNDFSRKKVQEGKVQVDDQEFQLNTEFINQVLYLSDRLNLDEVIAATVILHGTKQSKAYDRPVLQSATFLHFSRRQYILECLVLLFRIFSQQDIDKEVRFVIDKFIAKLYSAKQGRTFIQRCIEGMDSITNLFSDIAESERRTAMLGFSEFDSLSEDVTLQKNLLRKEQQALGLLLFFGAECSVTQVLDFEFMFNWFSTKDLFDPATVCVLPSLMSYIQNLTPREKVSYIQKKTTEEMRRIYKQVQTSISAKLAKECSSIACKFVSVVWFTLFNGFCQEDIQFAKDFNYLRDICEPTIMAIKSGIFDYAISLVLNFYRDPSIHFLPRISWSKFIDQRQLINLPETVGVSFLSHIPEITNLLLLQFKVFVDDFVDNLADILKQLRLAEEDNELSRPSPSPSSTEEESRQNYDLETFFLLIASLYECQLDSASHIWRDHDGNFFGFLLWAAQSHTPMMIWSFTELLCSLSHGAESAQAVFRLLSDPHMIDGSKNRPGMILSWQYTLDALNYYSNQLRPPMAVHGSIIPLRENTELDGESTKLIGSYLHLIAVILTYCEDARTSLNNQSQSTQTTAPSQGILRILFDLLSCKLPSDLVAGKFNCIRILARHSSIEERHLIWSVLDQWVLGSLNQLPASKYPLASVRLRNRNEPNTGPPHLMWLFHSTIEVYSFLELLDVLLEPIAVDGKLQLPFPDQLGDTTRSTGIQPYLDFVFAIAIDSALQLPFPLDSHEPTQTDLGALSIRIIRTCLKSLDLRIFKFADLPGIDLDSIVSGKTYDEYLCHHPGSLLFKLLMSRDLFSAFLDVLTIGIDRIEEQLDRSPLVSCVKDALDILYFLLSYQDPFREIVLPQINSRSLSGPITAAVISEDLEIVLAYRNEVIVHIALYLGSRYDSISSAAMDILVGVSTHEARAAKQQHKFVDLFATADESRRIQFGFMDKLNTENMTWNDNISRECLSVYGRRKTPKEHLLFGLDRILETDRENPTISHFLLGYNVTGLYPTPLELGSNTKESGISGLHCILKLVGLNLESPEIWNEVAEDFEEHYVRDISWQILNHLCRSELSSLSTLDFLRSHEARIYEQLCVGLSSLPFETIIQDLINVSLESTSDKILETVRAGSLLLHQRSILLDMLSLEIRSTTSQGFVSAVDRIIRYLIPPSSQQLQIMTRQQSLKISEVTDFLDFSKMMMEAISFPPELAHQDYSSCITRTAEGVPIIDIEAWDKINDLRKLSNPQLEKSSQAKFISALTLRNVFALAKSHTIQASTAWSRLLGIIIDSNIHDNVEIGAKEELVSSILYLVIPKIIHLSELDNSLIDIASSTLANLGRYSEKYNHNKPANNPIMDIFKAVSLAACNSRTSADAKYNLYTASYFIFRTSSPDKKFELLGICSDRFVEIVCQDILYNEGAAQFMALLFLGHIVDTAQHFKVDRIFEDLTRHNFLQNFIKSLRDCREWDVQNFDGYDISVDVGGYETKMDILLSVSKSPVGSRQLLRSGFFDVMKSIVPIHSVDLSNLQDTTDRKRSLMYTQTIAPVFAVVVSLGTTLGPQHRIMKEHIGSFISDHIDLVRVALKRMFRGGDNRADEASQRAFKIISMAMLLADIGSINEKAPKGGKANVILV
ncbi:Nucleoporin nup186 [Neolecta irregularis DAH-3]|uniref:Nucleoporin nup186 n=1 Tax=Neolecta irregularis (strain DAH-3) TaxID=1198029 RepID=A0A1U7LKT9_NEOID|nr:Nucleoporin nup186 [Neolecta irregularis DAH-3]|eukprot:OLL23141.1 Nucleoporin nup186 [Neolecta irregularis DAH-3]